jgi:hypothetical protein
MTYIDPDRGQATPTDLGIWEFLHIITEPRSFEIQIGDRLLTIQSLENEAGEERATTEGNHRTTVFRRCMGGQLDGSQTTGPC